MKIESTPDKLIIDEQELQQIIKDHVRAKLGRVVNEVGVQFSTSRASLTSAWMYLTDEKVAPASRDFRDI